MNPTPVDHAQAAALKDLVLVYFPSVCLLVAAFCWLAPKALDAWDRTRRPARRTRPPRSHVTVHPRPFDQAKFDQREDR